jgi:hypothetical protein
MRWGTLRPSARSRCQANAGAALLAGACAGGFNSVRLIESGSGPVHTSPEEFAACLETELVRYTRAIRDSGAKVE